MRLLLALFLLVASCIGAAAQGCGNNNPNCIVPTAPAGTSDNRAASTAFVQSNASGSAVKGPASSTVGDVPTFNNAAGTLIADPSTVSTNAQDFYFGTGRPSCDPRSKGAKGDNSTDDTVALNQCVTQLNTLGGGELLLSPGTYCAKTATSNNSAFALVSTQTILLHGTGALNTATISACGANVTPLLINCPYCEVSNVQVLGFNSPTATFPAILLRQDNGAFQKLSHVRVFYGSDAILSQSSDCLLDSVAATQGYVTASIHLEAGGCRIWKGAVDNGYPGTTPQGGVGLTNWATGTSYTANISFVVNAGWLWQATQSGTSAGAGSGPQPGVYGAAITDNTVIWKQVCPVGYSSIMIDTGAQETAIDAVDITGASYYGISLQNTLAGTAPFDIAISDSTLGIAFVSQIYAHDGYGLFLNGNHFGTQGWNGGQQLIFQTNFTGITTAVNNQFFGNAGGNAINISTGSWYSFTANRFLSLTNAITVPNATTHFSIAANVFDTVTTAVTVASGSSDYQIVGNALQGAALTYTSTDSTINIIGNGAAGNVTDALTFGNSDIAMLGSSTGKTTFTSANAGASNFTLTFPAATDTVVARNTSDTLTNKSLTSPTLTGTATMPDSSSWTSAGLANLLSETIVGGTLAAGANVATISATQPASPSATQVGVQLNITGNGSAAQTNQAFNVTYLAGYTGASSTNAAALVNSNAGTAGSLATTLINGNIASSGNSNATTTGWNVGLLGRGSNGNASIGAGGIAGTAKNSATNVGVIGSAINTGSSPVQIGGWFTNGGTTLPTTSAAVIADNNGQSNAIALWQASSSTVASVNSTGGLTATLTNAAGNEIVCYTSGTNGLMTYEPSVAGCVPSDPRLKMRGPDLSSAIALARLDTLQPGTGRFKKSTHLGNDERVWLYADQVCAMDARLCVKDKNGVLNYDKVGMLAYAIGAIKELKAANDNLRSQIAQLKKRAAR